MATTCRFAEFHSAPQCLGVLRERGGETGRQAAEKGKPKSYRLKDFVFEMEVKVMRVSALFIAVGLVCCPALPAIAQEGMSSAAVQPERGTEVLGTVVRGNTTIIFEAAGAHGIDLNGLRKWDQFAEEHPKIELL
jgi:hypothetical protein